jgi:stage V sporulation protein D (sporulation-specific penicillin-binding protein)
MGIAMNPNTGEILAMSNYPNFDPNNYKDYDSSQ